MGCHEELRSQVSAEESRYLSTLFNKFDENADGVISLQEMKRFLRALGVQMTEDETLSLVQTVDADGDGCLDLKEFTKMYRVLCENYVVPVAEEDDEEAEDNHLQEAFKVFDENGDGFISAAELGKVLAALGFAEGRCDAACEKMIRSADENGDGKVDFCEFKKMVLAKNLFV